ncbi:DUF397 domain-containing protein [Nocardiopsis sp. NPDC050513]|uniref:DUF397 domain-containing protein n=1 Tax=Nocardiopsis sp. NPDC050513 TaxID=3364338 RepID=UPI0037B427DA
MNSPQHPWHKSSYSSSTGECVEVSEGRETLMRDTRNRELGQVSVSAAEWSALINAITK